jgi:hypothetical protein
LKNKIGVQKPSKIKKKSINKVTSMFSGESSEDITKKFRKKSNFRFKGERYWSRLKSNKMKKYIWKNFLNNYFIISTKESKTH